VKAKLHLRGYGKKGLGRESDGEKDKKFQQNNRKLGGSKKNKTLIANAAAFV